MKRKRICAELTVYRDTDADQSLRKIAEEGTTTDLHAEYENNPFDSCTLFRVRIAGRRVEGDKVTYLFEHVSEPA